MLSEILLLDSSISQSLQNCSLHQPIPTLVSVIIETVYPLLNWGFLLNGKVFSFNNNNVLDDSDDLIYTIAEMFMLTIQTSSFAILLLRGNSSYHPIRSVNHTREQQIGLLLRGRPILLSHV